MKELLFAVLVFSSCLSRVRLEVLVEGVTISCTCIFQLSEWSKNDDKLMKAVESNDLSKADELLRKKSLNPTKLGPKGLSV